MKKKVLFMMPALPGGGAEKVLIDILRHFDYSRYDITLFLEFREGVYLEDVPERVEILALHKENNLWFQRLHRRLVEHGLYSWFHRLVYRRQFLRLLKGRRFDTVVSFMEGAALKFHSYITDRADRNISWVHIDLKKKHWSLDFFKDKSEELQAYNLMDRIVFVSEDSKKQFLSLFHIDSSKCCIVYNLIDFDDISRSATSMLVTKNKFTICMAGRMNKQKRYDRAIEVAACLKSAGYDFEIWILGSGELFSYLQNLIAARHLEDCVILKGFVKPPHPYMAKADIFLNCSESEGYPLTICEALCLGVPVVATDITGASEILDESRYGILVDENIESIFGGLKSLIDNPSLLKSYSEKSLERAESFNVVETMNKIYSIL